MSEARSELEKFRAALAASEQRAAAAEADLARARAVVSTSEAMIAALKRDKYGRSAERSAKLLDQLELQLEELVADAAEDRERAERQTTKAGAFERRKPVKKAFPDHLPRERVVVEAPSTCSYCGSHRIVKMGEDITETLEVIPRQWKAIQTVREKFTCRDCEKITQPPAPFHPIPRGWAGPSLLAFAIGLEHMTTQWRTVFEKYRQHQPLNRQAERYAHEGVELSLSPWPTRWAPWLPF
jgi:Transposase and inactivated derivatives